MDKDNEIIAKYMGWYKRSDQRDCVWWEKTDCAQIIAWDESDKKLPFDTDWNWLVKVLEKIHKDPSPPLSRTYREDLKEAMVSLKIENVFKFIVKEIDYINRYRSKK